MILKSMSAADLLIKKRRQRELSLGRRQSLTVLVLLLLGDDVKVKGSSGYWAEFKFGTSEEQI